jgi:hypothetical protein
MREISGKDRLNFAWSKQRYTSEVPWFFEQLKVNLDIAKITHTCNVLFAALILHRN